LPAPNQQSIRGPTHRLALAFDGQPDLRIAKPPFDDTKWMLHQSPFDGAMPAIRGGS